MTFAKKSDGTLFQHGDDDAQWEHSPLYEELVHIPLLLYVPGMPAGAYSGLTSVVDVMPTVLDILDITPPTNLDGRSLLAAMADSSLPGREYVVSTIPFANPGDPVRSVDNIRRRLRASPVTTVTSGSWSLLYSMNEGVSELYSLTDDPTQQENLIATKFDTARDLHEKLKEFMKLTNVPESLVIPRRELKI
jgi:arylsulfatase A-like enzyme